MILPKDSSEHLQLTSSISFWIKVIREEIEREHVLALASLDLQSVFPDLSSFCATPVSCSSRAEMEERI